jgi:hypothetical protein
MTIKKKPRFSMMRRAIIYSTRESLTLMTYYMWRNNDSVFILTDFYQCVNDMMEAIITTRQ